jgi:hypothetical protein
VTDIPTATRTAFNRPSIYSISSASRPINNLSKRFVYVLSDQADFIAAGSGDRKKVLDVSMEKLLDINEGATFERRCVKQTSINTRRMPFFR